MKITGFFWRTILSLALFLTSQTYIAAQSKPYDFPKIKPDDFKQLTWQKDSTASAIVLGDKGETVFEYNDNKGFQLVFTRHIRIRILKKEGYEYATFTIPLFRDAGSEETLAELKGFTYNLINGKVEDEKLSGSNIFNEQVTKSRRVTKFTLPGVKPGSIIDVRYKIISDFIWNIQEWEFQSRIPIQWSEYTVTIPEYFFFSKFARGSVPFVINKSTTAPGTISIVTKDRSEVSGLGRNNNTVRTTYERQQINFSQNLYQFAVADVPAIREEPYSPALSNIISSVEFELKYSQFPGEGRKDYTVTWQDICDLLLRHEDFGEQLQKGSIVKDAAMRIKASANTPYDKMAKAYAFITSWMTWNEKNGIYPTTTLREAIDKRSGNDADINLLLVLLLKQLDLKTAPVILSTREKGMLIESNPVLTQMNYVVAMADIDGKIYLLDATDKFRPLSDLPVRCLNGKGLLVSKDNMQWIPLTCDETENSLYIADMKISEDGSVSGILKVSLTGFSAESVRQEYFHDGEDKYFSSLRDHHKDWKVGEIKIENKDSLNAPVNQIYNLSSGNIAEMNGNLIYFNSLFGFGQNTNPFKAEKRESVIDFIYPLKDTYIFNIEIPAGYTVESLPEPVKILLPEQSGSFRFSANLSGNKLTINSVLFISKVMYTAEEYTTLRDFFSRVVAKHAQQVVVKKS